jgi:hypothetical protein
MPKASFTQLTVAPIAPATDVYVTGLNAGAALDSVPVASTM